jgi:nitroimidazol reductase NimA-like FMN-containing flavoprotein (pyridoxamine 5'-phosphate oxidase superfamily)
MDRQPDLRKDAELARQVIDTGRYVVLASADAEGRPWPTPVWYARDGREFIWVSPPLARHSNNIEVGSAVGLAIFETPVPVDDRPRAVYAEATASEASEADRERCLGAFNARSRADGLGTWTLERVTAPANLRLYHAVVSRLYVLQPDGDVCREVDLDL